MICFSQQIPFSDSIVDATENIRYSVDDKQVISAALLSHLKAFVRTSHNILLENMEALIFNSFAVSMTNMLLNGKIQKTILPTGTFDCIQKFQVVTQGTVLTPLLFNLFMNSSYACVDRNCTVLQCADKPWSLLQVKNIGATTIARRLRADDLFVRAQE